jgi:hypothetical protein
MVMLTNKEEREANKTTWTIVLEDATESELRVIDKTLRSLRIITSDIEYMKKGGYIE